MTKRKWLFLRGLSILVALLAACTQSGGPTSTPDHERVPPTVETPVRLIMIGDVNSYPANCAPGEVATLVLQFFEAYNAGNQKRLSDFYEAEFQGPGFAGWYSDTLTGSASGSEGQHFLTSSRDELLAYFAGRHVQHERLQLLLIGVTGPGWHGGVDIQYVFRRQADDLPPGADGSPLLGSGKGALLCPDQRIFVWSMATAAPQDDPEDYFHSILSCSRSAVNGTSPTDVIVCGREIEGE